jgi:hypothetical protein
VDQYQRPYFEAVNSLENFGTTVSFSMETLRANGKTPLYYRTGTIRDAIENFSFCAP